MFLQMSMLEVFKKWGLNTLTECLPEAVSKDTDFCARSNVVFDVASTKATVILTVDSRMFSIAYFKQYKLNSSYRTGYFSIETSQRFTNTYYKYVTNIAEEEAITYDGKPLGLRKFPVWVKLAHFHPDDEAIVHIRSFPGKSKTASKAQLKKFVKALSTCSFANVMSDHMDEIVKKYSQNHRADLMKQLKEPLTKSMFSEASGFVGPSTIEATPMEKILFEEQYYDYREGSKEKDLNRRYPMSISLRGLKGNIKFPEMESISDGYSPSSDKLHNKLFSAEEDVLDLTYDAESHDSAFVRMNNRRATRRSLTHLQ